ncbi:transposase, partial [Paenibacillus alkaliterrae]|nr:transposase [Paenibacillus alkaliterrae]
HWLNSFGLATALAGGAKVISPTKPGSSGTTTVKGSGNVGIPEITPKYATAIDNKVTLKEQVELPSWLKETYTDGHYRTVVTNESISVYRTFGGNAGENGAFATTVPAANRITSKINSALLPEWKNSRQYEAVIEIPIGTELNIGKVELQKTQTGTILQGGGDQILLPQNWPKEWIKEIREVPSR